jgi:GNAT superfamily N-acetyltransferase
MQLRHAEEGDPGFLSQVGRLACGLDDRPLPPADDPAVFALLPGPTDLAVIAADDERRLGAVWLHVHEPSLVVDEQHGPLPEITMAVQEDARGRGIGAGLLASLAADATQSFSAIALNVHMRNPAARLYIAAVSGSKGRAAGGTGWRWFGHLIELADRWRSHSASVVDPASRESWATAPGAGEQPFGDQRRRRWRPVVRVLASWFMMPV